MCANGTWGVATRWLRDMGGVQNIFHVTYVRNPAMDDPQSGLVGNKAYWLSDIQTRSTDPTQSGTIDVVSRGFGLADALAGTVVVAAGVEPGTTIAINSYTSEQRAKPAPLPGLAQDRLDITASNISTVTIDRQRARVSCNAGLHVTTDGRPRSAPDGLRYRQHLPVTQGAVQRPDGRPRRLNLARVSPRTSRTAAHAATDWPDLCGALRARTR